MVVGLINFLLEENGWRIYRAITKHFSCARFSGIWWAHFLLKGWANINRLEMGGKKGIGRVEAGLYTKSTIVLKRQGGKNGGCRTHGWIWVQAQVCGHLRRQVCLNNMKRAQSRAGCTSDTVIALTFLQRHFYVALQSARYKGLRSSERHTKAET